jgi:hypothetical protein
MKYFYTILSLGWLSLGLFEAFHGRPYLGAFIMSTLMNIMDSLEKEHTH